MWPDTDGPFRDFETYGWEWRTEWTRDENLIALVLANRLNCTKFSGYVGGHCSAVLCRPLGAGSIERPELEVVGLGVNTPPRFEPTVAAVSMGDVARRAGNGSTFPGRGKRHNEIHAEIQILARCARAGIPTAGAWMFIEMSPCWECCKALIAAGIKRIVFQCFSRPDLEEVERDSMGFKIWGRSMLAAEAAGIDWVGVPWCKRREEYIAELWQRHKDSRGLSRAEVKAMAS